jgi:hypothetical protein
MNTRTALLSVAVALMMLTGCIVPGPNGRPTLLVPPLPSVVWLESEPYYVHGGYTYFYRDEGWYYSRERSGPWVELPRDHYPRQVRYREPRGNPGKGHGGERGRDRDDHPGGGRGR